MEAEAKEKLRLEALASLERLRNAYKDEELVPELEQTVQILKDDLIFKPPKRGPKPRFDMNPVGKAVLNLIQDGEWYDVAYVIDNVSAVIPPGIAWRFAEGRRIQHYKTQDREPGPRVREVSQEAVIHSGRRQLANKCLHGLFRANRIEVEWNDPNSPRKRIARIKVVPFDD